MTDLRPAPEVASVVTDFKRDARERGDQVALASLAQQLVRATPGQWMATAECFVRADLLTQADFLLQQAIGRYPEETELFFMLGSVGRLAGNGQFAEQAMNYVLSREPRHVSAAITLALISRDRGCNSAAARMLCDLHRQQPGIDLALYVTDLLRQCRREAEAATVCEAELERHPTHARLLLTAGGLALTLGRFEDARRWLLAALDRADPQWEALMPLALAQKYRSDADPDIALFAAASQNRALPDSIRSGAGFALGKAFDDVGQFAKAAEAFGFANQIQAAQRRWQPSTWLNFVDAAIASHLPDPLQNSPPGRGHPVFVVGLPRTGTTLLAELLGRHSRIRSRGELPWLARAVQRIKRGNPGDRQEMRSAADLYLAQLIQDDTPADYYVDKNPLNFRHLGIASALFPDAKFVLCTRDRRDTALSIWSQSFDHSDLSWTVDLDSIKSFAAGYERLVAHWQQVLPGRITTVAYEDLVAEPPGIVDALLQDWNLSIEPLEASGKSGGAVNTGSVWQSRQPIYKNSVGRWRHYAPFIPALQGLS